MKQAAALLSLLALLASAPGCASAPPLPSNRLAAASPGVTVERFLHAANSGDLETMARIFGTARGPIMNQTGGTVSCVFRRLGSWFGLGARCVSWLDVELRMDAIAQLLRHDEYRVGSEANVAGRARPTLRLAVDLTRGGARYADVPFVVVQTGNGSWLVEEIGLERLTAGRREGEGLIGLEVEIARTG